MVQLQSKKIASLQSIGISTSRGLGNGSKNLFAMWQGKVACGVGERLMWQQATLAVTKTVALQQLGIAVISFSRFSFENVTDQTASLVLENVRLYIREAEGFKDDALFLATQSFRRTSGGDLQRLSKWLTELPISSVQYALKLKEATDRLCDTV